MVCSSRGHGLQKLWLLTPSTSEGLVAQWHVDPPRPGIEPVAPALAGRFLFTAPPGKSPVHSSFEENVCAYNFIEGKK